MARVTASGAPLFTVIDVEVHSPCYGLGLVICKAGVTPSTSEITVSAA